MKFESFYSKITFKSMLLYTGLFAIFIITVLPFISTLSSDLIGVSESPDLNFKFDLNHLFSIIDSYGREGRKYYLILRWTFDVIWPLVYTFFLVATIGYFSKKTKCKFTYKPMLLPLVPLMLDFVENIIASILMVLYPTTSKFLGYMLMTTSLLKWVTLMLCFIILVILVIRFIVLLIYKDRK